MQIIEIIEQAFDNKSQINSKTEGDIRNAVNKTLAMLDTGEIRVCQKKEDSWQVNSWVKKAILLSFRLNDNYLTYHDTKKGDSISFFDKVPLKFAKWQESDFSKAGFRTVSGAVVRHATFIAKNVVLMPSFVNLGAYIDEGTMIDTWATVGSCAQIGKNCHISGGAGIGGVLEPLQSNPVIIEDKIGRAHV